MTGTTSHNEQYEPPANDSIIQGAGAPPRGLFMTNTTNTTTTMGRNETWRDNNGASASTHTTFPPCKARPTGHKSFFNDSPNSFNNRNVPMCFRCGEQGHMRNECIPKKCFAPTARTPAKPSRHAENSQLMHQAQPTATFQQVTTQQPPRHHYQKVYQTRDHN